MSSVMSSRHDHELIPGIPDDVIYRHLIQGDADNAPLGPIDLARLSAVSKSWRDSIRESGRKVYKMLDAHDAVYHFDSIGLMLGIREGMKINETTCAYASKLGNIEALQILIEAHCPIDLQTAEQAAFRGYVDILELVFLQEVDFGPSVTQLAALGGQFNSLEWLRQHGYEWTCDTCVSTGISGDLEVLQWLIQEGCPLNEETFFMAALYGQLNILQYLYGRFEHIVKPYMNELITWSESGGDHYVINWVNRIIVS